MSLLFDSAFAASFFLFSVSLAVQAGT